MFEVHKDESCAIQQDPMGPYTYPRRILHYFSDLRKKALVTQNPSGSDIKENDFSFP